MTHLCSKQPDDLVIVPRWYLENLQYLIMSVPDWYNDECLDGVHDE
jgi:hypothetical protein